MMSIWEKAVIYVIKIWIIATLLSFSTLAFAEEKPQAEILHWWASESESSALQVFVDEFLNRGGWYYDSSRENQRTTRDEAIARMIKGYPVTFVQWGAGWDIRDFYDYGLLRPITDPALVDSLRTVLPPLVLDAVTYKDSIVAIPLNVHGENWIWHNTDLLGTEPLELAGDWSSFVKEGERLAEQSVPLLAVGDESWQVRFVFASLMLGISPDVYTLLFMDKDSAVVGSKALETTLRTFNALSRYSQSFGQGSWTEQVAAVATGRAAANIMGDWAKMEFINLGLQPGVHFGCTLTPSDDPRVLMGIDSFLMGNVSDPLETAGQDLLLEVATDPQINMEFNRLKGSASPYAQTTDTDMDVCSSQVYRALEGERKALMPPYGSYPDASPYMDSLNEEIETFWKNSLSGDDADMLVSDMLETIARLVVERTAWLAHQKKYNKHEPLTTR